MFRIGLRWLREAPVTEGREFKYYTEQAEGWSGCEVEVG